jgi:hypothetical protein
LVRASVLALELLAFCCVPPRGLSPALSHLSDGQEKLQIECAFKLI